MAAGPVAAFDKIAALVASTSLSIVDNSGRDTLERLNARLDFDDVEDTAVHRRFHVSFAGMENHPEGRFAGTLTDSYLTVTVQVGYYEGGGDVQVQPTDSAYTSDRHGVDRMAMEDLDRMRQHVENPDNYAVSTTGIQLISWQGTRRLPLSSRKRIYETTFRVWIEHARLS